jgi:hypothetical protein
MSFWEGGHRDFHQAADDYFRALQRTGVPEDDTRRAAEAYETYTRAAQEASPPPELYQRAVDAYGRYADAVREIWSADGRAEPASDAYRGYLVAIREAWASADPERLDPASLATTAESMLGVAWAAGLCAHGPPRPEIDAPSSDIWTTGEQGVHTGAGEPEGVEK